MSGEAQREIRYKFHHGLLPAVNHWLSRNLGCHQNLKNYAENKEKMIKYHNIKYSQVILDV